MLKFKVVYVFVFICLAEFGATENTNSPQISIGSTTFIGSLMQTWKGRPFSAFRGIKYGVPPTGSLRFKDPKPILQYELGLYDASVDKNDCPSILAVHSSEDCLFLNVYTKNTPFKNFSNLLPVIAFIHPGGFYLGSALSSFIGPDYLLEENIVLVTFNYRLGSLGFLNLGTESIPGNAGLKDQVLALKWIKDHISYFGGDPTSVTLMGYSAGAFSASLHLVSPMSQGLFHKAIIMSGSIPPQTVLREDQIHLAARQVDILGCKYNKTSEDILNCLNSFSGDQIANTLRQMFDFGKDNPVFLWLPVIEKDFGQERFLTEDPYKALQMGNFNKVPILIGFTKNELCTSAVDILTNSSLMGELNTKFNHLAPICFMYSHTSDDGITNLFSQHYSLEVPLNITHMAQLCNLYSDSIIRFGSHRLGQIASEFTDVFTYKFSYSGRFSNLYYPKHGDVLGAEHMDDLMYLFKMFPATFAPTDVESVVVELMTNLIATFTTFGTPLQQSSQMWNFSSGNYAEITDVVEIKSGLNFEEANFWNTLFPLPR